MEWVGGERATLELARADPPPPSLFKIRSYMLNKQAKTWVENLWV